MQALIAQGEGGLFDNRPLRELSTEDAPCNHNCVEKQRKSKRGMRTLLKSTSLVPAAILETTP
eukprot:2949505-Amphidinium_carterae.2